MEKKIIGYAGVDSGQLLLIDPCYLGDWKDGEYGEKNDYTIVSKITASKNMGGEHKFGVAFGTGYGDGNYPVEATYEDNRIKSVKIKFF